MEKSYEHDSESILANDDGHTSECNYQACAHPESPEPCPFVRQSQPSAPKSDCVHDWRQYYAEIKELVERPSKDIPVHLDLTNVDNMTVIGVPPQPDGFYCTKCLDRHD